MQLCCALSLRMPRDGQADEVDLAALAGWNREQFFAIHLLRARQARLQGDDLAAEEEYNRVLEEAMARGPNFLLDVEAGERSK